MAETDKIPIKTPNLTTTNKVEYRACDFCGWKSYVAIETNPYRKYPNLGICEGCALWAIDQIKNNVKK